MRALRSSGEGTLTASRLPGRLDRPLLSLLIALSPVRRPCRFRRITALSAIAAQAGVVTAQAASSAKAPGPAATRSTATPAQPPPGAERNRGALPLVFAR